MASLVQTFITDSLVQFPFQPTLSQIENGLQKAKIKPSDVLDGSNGDIALAYVLQQMIPFLPESVTEGGYSVKWDKKTLSDYIDGLFSGAGVVNPFTSTPTVRDASYYW